METKNEGEGAGVVIESCGIKILLQDEDDNDGDSFALVKERDRYGFLIFGWGEGCCKGEAECNYYLNSSKRQICNSATWGESPGSLIEYLENKDWDIENQTPEIFVNKVIELLKNINEGEE